MTDIQRWLFCQLRVATWFTIRESQTLSSWKGF